MVKHIEDEFLKERAEVENALRREREQQINDQTAHGRAQRDLLAPVFKKYPVAELYGLVALEPGGPGR